LEGLDRQVDNNAAEEIGHWRWTVEYGWQSL